MSLLTVALLLTVSAADILGPVDKDKEQQEDIARLRENIAKIDRSIAETENLISRARSAPYLPDLQFSLAELYVEKSRYVFQLSARTRPEGQKGSAVSAETRLLKEKGIQIYTRLLREFPTFKEADKVQFYLAHENRELGNFDKMLEELDVLIKKYPKSPLRLEAHQIIADYHFDKSNLDKAEEHYKAILAAPLSPAHDLARYKMGWIRVNQDKHAEAMPFFEAVALSPTPPGVDPTKALNVKREALVDLVFSYTEVMEKARKEKEKKGKAKPRAKASKSKAGSKGKAGSKVASSKGTPSKSAMKARLANPLGYFQRLSDSRTTYVLALDKLANRLFIKQRYAECIPILRKLLEIRTDPQMDGERVHKLYDALKATKGKVSPTPTDVKLIVRAAKHLRLDGSEDVKEQQKYLAIFEEEARDLATLLHLAAQKGESIPKYRAAADAYEEYLQHFRPEKHLRTILKNRSDALFAAKDFVNAARQFEELAQLDEADPKHHQPAMYGALLAHHTSLKPGELEKRSLFELVDARQALKLDGETYATKYPKDEHVPQIRFNIARAHYEDGEFEKASELFVAFALAFPSNKDATVAGQLALDSHRQLRDFKGLEAAGKKLLGAPLPGTFLAQVRKTMSEAKNDAVGELALKSLEETGDMVDGLLKVAAENKGVDIGEKALYGALSASRERGDFVKMQEIASRFLQEYPKSPLINDVLSALGRGAAESGRFAEAAARFEQLAKQLGNDAQAIDGWLAAGKLRIAMGDYAGAVKVLEQAAPSAQDRRSDVLALVASAHLKSGDLSRARSAAEKALRADPPSPLAGAILGEVLVKNNDTSGIQPLMAAISRMAAHPDGGGSDTAKAYWHLGELMYQTYKSLPPEMDKKASAMQEVEAAFMQTAQLGAAEWVVAAMWKVALSYKHLSEVVANVQPDGMKAAERAQFTAAVKEQAQALAARADEMFNTCVTKAQELEVFNLAALGCRTRSEAPSLKPVKLAAGGEDPATWEKKAWEKPDGQNLLGLGVSYLGSGKVALAQLTLSRAAEIGTGTIKASSQNALGMALLRSGEGTDARAAFGKALELEPDNAKARANLAALRCRYGDKDGARKELGQVRGSAKLDGADLDPEWRACR